MKMLNPRVNVAVLSCLLALGLGGCGGALTSTGAGAGSSTGAAEAGDAASSERGKLNAYIDAYNQFFDTASFEEQYKEYRTDTIADHHGLGLITEYYIQLSLNKLKKARALKAGYAELDAAADPVIDAMQKVLTRLSALKVYESSKAYLEDHDARFKKEDPLMQAEFKAAADALDKLGGALDQATERRDEAVLAKLKASGNVLAYDNQLLLHQAKGLLTMLQNGDPKDPALFQKADQQVAIMEKNMDELRQALDKAKQAGERHGGVEGAVYDLTAMVGAYRSLKQYPKGGLQQVVESYNRAIESENGD